MLDMGELGGWHLFCGTSHLHAHLMLTVPSGAAQFSSLDEGHIELEAQCLAGWTFGAKPAVPMYSFKFH